MVVRDGVVEFGDIIGMWCFSVTSVTAREWELQTEPIIAVTPALAAFSAARWEPIGCTFIINEENSVFFPILRLHD